MKQVEIYQLSIEQDGIFRSLEFNQEHGFEIKAKNYQQVYTCERPDDYGIEDAFVEFNCSHPEDFRGHSLSVSSAVSNLHAHDSECWHQENRSYGC
jgi:hypothetical protein